MVSGEFSDAPWLLTSLSALVLTFGPSGAVRLVSPPLHAPCCRFADGLRFTLDLVLVLGRIVALLSDYGTPRSTCCSWDFSVRCVLFGIFAIPLSTLWTSTMAASVGSFAVVLSAGCDLGL